MTLTAREADYAQAWALAIESADPRDRRMVALAALAALGNVAVIRCAAHGIPSDPLMTFSAAYSHTTTAPSRCQLSAETDKLR